MPFAKAGRYNEILFVNRRVAPNTDANIINSSTGASATLYSDRDKTTTLTSSIVRSDQAGNLFFFADPGYYDIVVSGEIVSKVTVPLDYEITDSLASASDSRFTQIVHNTQTASYTLVLADAGKLIEMNVAGANTLTVPPNSSVAFPVGTIIGWRQYGAGQITLTQGAGVTIRSSGGKLKSGAQYAEGTLTKRGTDEWVASGDLVV